MRFSKISAQVQNLPRSHSERGLVGPDGAETRTENMIPGSAENLRLLNSGSSTSQLPWVLRGKHPEYFSVWRAEAVRADGSRHERGKFFCLSQVLITAAVTGKGNYPHSKTYAGSQKVHLRTFSGNRWPQRGHLSAFPWFLSMHTAEMEREEPQARARESCERASSQWTGPLSCLSAVTKQQRHWRQHWCFYSETCF